MYPPEKITDLMAECDYVVVSTPYTPSTHGLVSAAAIAAMRPNSVLVNASAMMNLSGSVTCWSLLMQVP